MECVKSQAPNPLSVQSHNTSLPAQIPASGSMPGNISLRYYDTQVILIYPAKHLLLSDVNVPQTALSETPGCLFQTYIKY